MHGTIQCAAMAISLATFIVYTLPTLFNAMIEDGDER